MPAKTPTLEFFLGVFAGACGAILGFLVYSVFIRL
jgi:hypothetical protein